MTRRKNLKSTLIITVGINCDLIHPNPSSTSYHITIFVDLIMIKAEAKKRKLRTPKIHLSQPNPTQPNSTRRGESQKTN